ncbi:MAG TPA: hypothetical protein VK679_09835, partial [Gemmatimonadaceae bacterium]|nr:hypothetical protein [Gemmatimonadaceae bacterium]
MHVALFVSLVLQQAPGLPASPIARVIVTPPTREITAGDSVRISVKALDASGKPVTNAIVRYTMRGGQGEGRIDSTGMIVASSVGKLPLNVVALVPGTKPIIQPIEFHVVPGKAVRAEIRT